MTSGATSDYNISKTPSCKVLILKMNRFNIEQYHNANIFQPPLDIYAALPFEI